MINLDWKESSPGVTDAPGEHEGFGSQILSRIVPMDFQGEAEHRVLPEGLHYRVSARRDRVDNSGDEAAP
jgi:two-component sensor histidine kinase